MFPIINVIDTSPKIAIIIGVVNICAAKDIAIVDEIQWGIFLSLFLILFEKSNIPIVDT